MVRPSIHRAVFIVVAIVFSLIPFVTGRLMQPAGTYYYAAYNRAPGDTSIYYRYIEQGRTGGPLMRDFFTTDAHPAILWQPVWWAVGRTAETFGISTPNAFAGARAVGAAVLAATMWWAAGLLWRDRRRVWSVWVGYFGAGVGGWMIFLFRSWTNAWHLPPYDLWVSEAYPWLSSLASPHFLLVTAGLLAVMIGTEQCHSRRSSIWLGVVLLMLTSIHPFHILTIGLTWAGLTIVEALTAAPEWRLRLVRRISIGVWAIPSLVYYALTWFQPIMLERATQNINSTFIWISLVGFVPLMIAALMAFRFRRDRSIYILAMWGAAIMLATILPLDFQRRFVQPLAVPLGLLGGFLFSVWWSAGRLKRAAVIAPCLLMVASPIAGIATAIHTIRLDSVSTSANFTYLRPEYVRLLDALKTHPEWSPVLTSRIEGNILGAFDPVRVYLGHGVETTRFKEKSDQMKHFFTDWSSGQQASFLRSTGVCSVLVTPYTQTYGTAFPGRDVRMVPLFSAGDLVLYSGGCEASGR